MSDSATPWTVAHQAPLSTGILQARILEWVACPSPGNLPNPWIKLRCPALQADSLTSKPPRKPKNTGVWIAYAFCRGSCWPRNQTRVSCFAGRFFTSWATREAHFILFLIWVISILSFSLSVLPEVCQFYWSFKRISFLFHLFFPYFSCFQLHWFLFFIFIISLLLLVLSL